MFQCPSDTGTRLIRPSAFAYYGTSYRMNHLLLGQPAVPANLPGDPCQEVWADINQRLWSLTANSLNDPSRLLLMGDYTWYEVWERQLIKDFPYWHGRKQSANLAFVDGHVEHVQVRKGIHVDKRYTIMPYADLAGKASGLQVELLPSP